MTDWLKDAEKWDELARTAACEEMRDDAQRHADFCRWIHQRELDRLEAQRLYAQAKARSR